MKCRHLNQFRLSEFGWTVESCEASDRPYAPTLAELNDYCKGVKFANCPILTQKNLAFESKSLLFGNHVIA